MESFNLPYNIRQVLKHVCINLCHVTHHLNQLFVIKKRLKSSVLLLIHKNGTKGDFKIIEEVNQYSQLITIYRFQ